MRPSTATFLAIPASLLLAFSAASQQPARHIAPGIVTGHIVCADTQLTSHPACSMRRGCTS